MEVEGDISPAVGANSLRFAAPELPEGRTTGDAMASEARVKGQANPTGQPDAGRKTGRCDEDIRQQANFAC